MSLLHRYSEALRGSLPKLLRLKVVALVTVEVHARDVIDRLHRCPVPEPSAFDWLSQLRLYWDKVRVGVPCWEPRHPGPWHEPGAPLCPPGGTQVSGFLLRVLEEVSLGWVGTSGFSPGCRWAVWAVIGTGLGALIFDP